MASKPQVSILMPVHNVRPFLPVAVQSVFAQTTPDWELVAVDDASSDGSREYLESIDDPRVTVLRNGKQLGLALTVNRAIEAATAPYCARFDGDDALVPERLERQLSYLQAHPVDLLGSAAYDTGPALDLMFVWRPPLAHAAITRRPAVDIPMMNGAMMARREWWQRWRHDPRTGYPGVAYELLYRSYRESVLENMPEPLYIYRFFGHTSSWRKRSTGAWRKAQTLARFGLRHGTVLQTVAGLASLAPRPLLYLASDLVGRKGGIVGANGGTCSPEDRAAYTEALRIIEATEVPARHA